MHVSVNVCEYVCMIVDVAVCVTEEKEMCFLCLVAECRAPHCPSCRLTLT